MGNYTVNNDYIFSLLEEAKNVSNEEIEAILDKADNLLGLNHTEIAKLLMITDKKHQDRILNIAGRIKKEVYGDRVVMFAPLYVSDYCVNKCTYCGFNCDSKNDRKRLTMDEIRDEVKILESMGHKRLALEAGEDPVNCPLSYILETIDTIYNMKFENGAIRRVNVNIAATTVEEYKMLKDAEIGTYILFQETYHKDSYEKYHLGGPKRNYQYHTEAFDRAMEAGIDDVGGGVLFGFYDYKFELLAMMMHTEHLEQKYGHGFHTISVPRICKVEGVENEYEHAVDDDTFKKIVALLRIAVPYTGIIISTRESADMRKDLINAGVSQVSAGSSVEVYGYSKKESNSSQFTVSDERTPMEILKWLMSEELVPSFCTACYRQGRTGDRFMELAKSNNIKNVCLPNGLMTLKEYALDYGDDEFLKLTDKLIEKKLKDIGSEKVLELVKENLEKLKKGERDLYL